MTELTVASDATVPDTGPTEHRNARAFFRFPLQSDAPDCELRLGHPAALLRLAHRGPDPGGRPARRDVEGEHAHLGQPARPGRGRRRRHDRSR